MADPIIRLKRSAVFGKIPTADQLPLGEVALNTYDGYLYASKNVGVGTTVIAINPFRVGTGTDSYNTYFTQGNVGLGLTNPTERLHVSGNVTITGITTFQDDVNLGDDDKIILGDGDDLQIYHNGSASYISDQGEGQLRILTNKLQVKNTTDNATSAVFNSGGAVTLNSITLRSLKLLGMALLFLVV